ncbi:MAG: murein biosynthesis integral membrane protein MurJ [Verrucomicrobia bacterium]|nr:murein biosynthesis integral membrane protein MurJ [Verrucomicrobiota bacterium]
MSAETSSASSITRSVTVASAIMMTSVLLSRILGIVREMVLASYGGTRSEMDAYVASFLLPEIVNHLLAGGFMSVTFIPIFQRHLAQNRRDLAWKAFSNLITTGSLVIAVLTGLCLVFTENILGLMGRHITDPHQLALTARMTRIILPAQIFFYWGALLLAVQYAEKRFFIPALAPLIYNAGIILGGVVLSPFVGIEGFAWGVLGGSFLGNFVVQALGARASGLAFRWRCDWRDPDLRNYVLVTVPLVAGLGMQFSTEVFFRYFGSFLGPGGLASLNYALRTMMALVAVFGQAFGVAAFPFLSQYVAEKRYREMNSLLFSMISKVAVIMIPFSLLMMVLSRETVALIFQRGRFTEASTLATAPVLIMYCLGAFGLAATNMVSRGFYAVQNTVLPMVVSSLAALASLPLYWFFMQQSGAPGIALVGSLGMIGQFVVLMWLWTKRYQGGPELHRLLVMMGKVVAISALGCALGLGIAAGLDRMTMIQGLRTSLRSALVLGASGIPAALLIFLVFDRLGIADFRAIISRLLRKKERATGKTP